MRHKGWLTATRVSAASVHAVLAAVEPVSPPREEGDVQSLRDRRRLAVGALAATLVEDFAGVARLVLAASLYREAHGDPDFDTLVGAATQATGDLTGAQHAMTTGG